jgi:hypothetical protein
MANFFDIEETCREKLERKHQRSNRVIWRSSVLKSSRYILKGCAGSSNSCNIATLQNERFDERMHTNVLRDFFICVRKMLASLLACIPKLLQKEKHTEY